MSDTNFRVSIVVGIWIIGKGVAVFWNLCDNCNSCSQIILSVSPQSLIPETLVLMESVSHERGIVSAIVSIFGLLWRKWCWGSAMVMVVWWFWALFSSEVDSSIYKVTLYWSTISKKIFSTVNILLWPKRICTIHIIIISIRYLLLLGQYDIIIFFLNSYDECLWSILNYRHHNLIFLFGMQSHFTYHNWSVSRGG